MHRSIYIIFIGFITLSGYGQSGKSWFHNIDENNIAINSYDVTTYFTETEPKIGEEKHSETYEGIRYLFSSDKNKQTFKNDPEKYAPKYGGWCAYRMAQKLEEVGWAQSRIPIDPLSYKIINGSLYLFSNVAGNAKEAWENHDQNEMITRADSFWKSRVELSELANGKPDGLNPTARMENLLWQRFMGKWKGTGQMLVSLEPKRYSPYPPATWTFWYGFNGFCIQDEWVASNDIGGTWNGPAIRGYDPAKQEWHMTFIPVNAGRDATWLMTGNFNDKMELEGTVEGTDPRGMKYIQRIFFYEIEEESFSWRADRSYDEGKTWIEKFLDIQASRID